MSAFTVTELKENIRVGFTAKRGPAWWGREDDGSHYVDAVPAAAARELLDWEPLIGEVQVNVITEHGVTNIIDRTRQAMVHPTGEHVIGIMGSKYKPHPYGETLIDITQAIVDDTELEIASVGTLGGGARGFISFELPDTVQAAEGVEIRPFLNAASSLDGSLATQWFRAVQLPVCDNTLAASIATGVDFFKVRHTTNSGVKLAEAREALNIVYELTEDYLAEIEFLTGKYVTDQQWSDFLDATVPMPASSGRAATNAEQKRAQLNGLWNADPRVAPWKNSAYGVLAATNTWENNFANIRGATRLERNKGKLIDGTFEKSDRRTLRTLSLI